MVVEWTFSYSLSLVSRIELLCAQLADGVESLAPICLLKIFRVRRQMRLL